VAVRAVRPTDVSHELGGFDRFAELASRLASRAWFFFCCVLIVVVWAPSLAVFKNIDTWQLVINTLTTIVTFLLVALLQNSQTRSDLAVQHKLNAIADGLADLMAHLAKGDHGAMDQDMRELRAAVGLESRESTSDNEVDRPDGQAGPNGSTGSDGVKGGPPGAEPLAAVAPRRSAAEKPA
jgi:hypothetical protein